MSSARAPFPGPRFTFVLGLLIAACSGDKALPPGKTQVPTEPGRPVTGTTNPAQQAELTRVQGALATVDKLDTAGLLQKYPAPVLDKLSYDPLTAQHLDLIAASPLALTPAEKSVLGRTGLVISDRRRFPTFAYGYETIYMADLPIFVSADSILYALHRSYDDILKAIELWSLRADLDDMLVTMRGKLAAGALSALGDTPTRDTDVYLSVALSLLRGQPVAPVAGGSAADVRRFFEKATANGEAEQTTLFGAKRQLDFSQFKPRGHYTDHADLETYFRAMIWLGRIDLRLIETEIDGSQLFHRRQFEAMLALATLVQDSARDAWTRLDRTIEMFVGESDNMRLPEVDKLLADLSVTSLQGAVALPDDKIVAAVVAGGYGAQRISSHFMVNGTDKGTLPLSRTFLLLGQRYVLDSHVFSNVVYDRAGGGAVRRMMPNPLDVAFAALGNNQAGKLLVPELDKYGYATDLAAMRVLADDHGDAFWNANLYNVWLSALRTLSAPASNPAAGGASSAGDDSGPLEIARTEPWGRRLLNTQLASWAELRHDTILYVKQSYTAGGVCEFPDALVEPNPAFFARIEQFAKQGVATTAALRFAPAELGSSIAAYFAHLQQVAALLGEMATYQKDGKPFSATHMAFINEAVRIQRVCGSASAEGWYAQLFFNHGSAAEYDPTIADVHTQPTDEGGANLGRILHVGTGHARMMVVTAKTCAGPKAYVGLASSYFEHFTNNWVRLDDPAWQKILQDTPPADVPWMTDLIAR